MKETVLYKTQYISCESGNDGKDVNIITYYWEVNADDYGRSTPYLVALPDEYEVKMSFSCTFQIFAKGSDIPCTLFPGSKHSPYCNPYLVDCDAPIKLNVIRELTDEEAIAILHQQGRE